MAINKHKVYIDTSTSGLIIIVDHNLSGTPIVTLTDYDTSQEVYVSFYDPRLSEVKVLDSNSIQFTFASTFKGYAYFYQIEVDTPSALDRLTTLEEKYIELLQSMDLLTNKDQWIQMNTLFQRQIDALDAQTQALQNQVNLLADDVDKL